MQYLHNTLYTGTLFYIRFKLTIYKYISKNICRTNNIYCIRYIHCSSFLSIQFRKEESYLMNYPRASITGY